MTSASIRNLLLAGLLATTFTLSAAASNSRRGADAVRRPEQSVPHPTFEMDAETDVYPVLASYASSLAPGYRDWGVITVSVVNSSPARLRERIAVEIAGWSEEEIQIAELAAGQTQQFRFAPTLLARALSNRALAGATAAVTVTDPSGHITYSNSVPVRMHSMEDMYWGSESNFARFLASWVTPHDSRVEALVARARLSALGGKLPGYENDKTFGQQERSTLQQVQAIYDAVQHSGLSAAGGRSAVESALPNHVQLPHESLEHHSASPIDGAVLYASLFENVGLQTVVLLSEGHAYIGVRLSDDVEDYAYVETSFPAREDFTKAMESAVRGLNRDRAHLVSIQIPDAREDGIEPLASEPRAAAVVQTSGLR